MEPSTDMRWNEIKGNWAHYTDRLTKRFPYLSAQDLTAGKPESPDEMVQTLARSHELTQIEAAEELENWLMIEGLARDASAIGLAAPGNVIAAE